MGRQIAEEIPARLRGFGRPLDEQPDFFAGFTALMKSVRSLHPPRPKAGLQPTLAAFPPANFLPACGLLSGLLDRDWPLFTVVQRTGWAPGRFRFQRARLRSEER